MESKSPMPVTILTGFLGTGKTTLLNEILRQKNEAKILVIENEAGDINIDNELIQGAAQNRVLDLAGGCICCSLSTELGTMLNGIIMSGVRYDYVIVEATGIADCGRIIDQFTGPRVERFFKLDSVVGLVDASTFLNNVENYTEIRKQMAQSDSIVINKCDLIDSIQEKQLTSALKEINPLAQILQTTHGKIECEQILNIDRFNAKTVETSFVDFSKMKLVKTERTGMHDIDVKNYSISGDFDIEKVSFWFDQFMNQNKENILRIKAILSIDEMQHKIILQNVGDNFHISQGSVWEKNEPRENKIVIIGTSLLSTDINKGLTSLLV